MGSANHQRILYQAVVPMVHHHHRPRYLACRGIYCVLVSYRACRRSRSLATVRNIRATNAEKNAMSMNDGVGCFDER